MWSKSSQNELPNLAGQGTVPSTASVHSPTGMKISSPAARNLSCLGSSLEIKGKISGEEDLQIDGKVEGPISLTGQRLTVGRGAQIHSEVTAREVIIYGKVTGNLRVRDRVEIKKDGGVIGDIWTARISIEDGADYKGRIEIEPTKSASSPELDSVSVPIGTGAN